MLILVNKTPVLYTSCLQSLHQLPPPPILFSLIFFFHDPATTDIYTLSLHDALPIAVGILALAQFLPFTVFGLFAGVVVDRLDARRTVIWTQAAQMALASLIAALALAGIAQPWHIYVIAALNGTLLVLDAPARQALTYRMVGPAELQNAISLNSSLFNAARIFGPAVAGIVIAAVGVGWCFALNAA